MLDACWCMRLPADELGIINTRVDNKHTRSPPIHEQLGKNQLQNGTPCYIVMWHTSTIIHLCVHKTQITNNYTYYDKIVNRYANYPSINQ